MDSVASLPPPPPHLHLHPSSPSRLRSHHFTSSQRPLPTTRKYVRSFQHINITAVSTTPTPHRPSSQRILTFGEQQEITQCSQTLTCNLSICKNPSHPCLWRTLRVHSVYLYLTGAHTSHHSLFSCLPLPVRRTRICLSFFALRCSVPNVIQFLLQKPYPLPLSIFESYVKNA